MRTLGIAIFIGPLLVTFALAVLQTVNLLVWP